MLIYKPYLWNEFVVVRGYSYIFRRKRGRRCRRPRRRHEGESIAGVICRLFALFRRAASLTPKQPIPIY